MTEPKLFAGHTMTRQGYLLRRALIEGGSPFVVLEAVASTALAHPEWDMDEERTWEQWEVSGD